MKLTDIFHTKKKNKKRPLAEELAELRKMEQEIQQLPQKPKKQPEKQESDDHEINAIKNEIEKLKSLIENLMKHISEQNKQQQSISPIMQQMLEFQELQNRIYQQRQEQINAAVEEALERMQDQDQEPDPIADIFRFFVSNTHGGEGFSTSFSPSSPSISAVPDDIILQKVPETIRRNIRNGLISQDQAWKYIRNHYAGIKKEQFDRIWGVIKNERKR